MNPKGRDGALRRPLTRSASATDSKAAALDAANPWEYRSQIYPYNIMQTCDQQSRLEIVRLASPEKLRQIIAWPQTQAPVLERAKSRLSARTKKEG